MTQYANQFKAAPRRRRLGVYLLGTLALAPLGFMSREIVTGDFEALNISNADVLGSGTFVIFLTMMAITPLITVSGARWFAPLRWWLGVMFFVTAAIDLVIAAIVTGEDFKGGVFGRVAGHTFLLVGTTSVVLSVVLVATASHRAQRKLGKYWKPVQRVTYAVWALILLHLALLFGLTGDRFLQALSASAPLLVLRLPPVRRWWIRERGLAGWRNVLLWGAGLVLLTAFVYGYAHLVGELISRGINALSNHPSDT